MAQPSSPILVSPADTAVHQPTKISLIWNSATGAVTYGVEFATDSSFSVIVKRDTTVTGTSFYLDSLLLNTKYFWRVRSKSAEGTGSFSPTFRFTTWASVPLGPLPVNLGNAAGFSILAYSEITSVTASAITGNVGVSPAAGAFLGLTQTQVTGTMYTVDATGPAGSVVSPSFLTQATGDLTIAYNDAAGRTVSPVGLAGNLGGQTLYAGLYKSSGTLEISAGDLTLDANGNSNSVWIFQIASSFNMTSGRQVFLTNGAKASNIFWQVGTAATFGTTSVMKGTIMAGTQVTMATGATLEGRALALTANVTLQQNTITIPSATTSVGIGRSSMSFDLLQNFPNPFNPETTISFDLPMSGHVHLAVYDLLGREVAIVVDGLKSQGRYEEKFSAVDISSGVYFYQLTSGGQRAIRKMTILK